MKVVSVGSRQEERDVQRSSVLVWANVRCLKCGRLLFKWHPRGVAVIDVKCTRCGSLDTLALSTG